MTYLSLKEWLVSHKDKIVLGACFVLMFFVGYGTGVYAGQGTKVFPSQINYTTKPVQKPAPAAETQIKKEAVQGTSTLPNTQDCLIKGNISAAGRKIYHVPGGSFYKRTKAEQCFNTETEAKASGFVRSSK